MITVTDAIHPANWVTEKKMFKYISIKYFWVKLQKWLLIRTWLLVGVEIERIVFKVIMVQLNNKELVLISLLFYWSSVTQVINISVIIKRGNDILCSIQFKRS